jgi:hypothetical protein
MKRISIQIAVLGFFVLAGVGWASGLSPAACSLRASVGAACLYMVIRFAGNVAIRLLADAAAESVRRARQEGNHR